MASPPDATAPSSHPRIERFTLTERVLHWMHASAFFALLATGLILYVPALSTLISRRNLVKNVHIWVAVAWAIALVVIVVAGDRKRLASDWREIETIDRDDRRWLRGRLVRQGRFNAGQKVNALLTVAFALLFALSGFFLWLGERDHRFIFAGTGTVHVVLTFLSVGLLVGHLYLALIHPSTRRALRGMTTGEVDEAWALEHHAKWVEAERLASVRERSTPDELGGAIGRFRELRRRFEQAIPAAAVSMDGRSFGYQMAIGSTVPPPGGFVALVDGDARRLGQLITQELVTRDGPEVGASLDGESLSGDGALDLQARVQVRVVEGTGVVLSGDGAPFVDARIEEATGPEVAELSRPKRNTTDLVIGTVLAGRDEVVPARIDAGGFDRHTFLCGQSGSGKTYSLGVVLEQLLLNTELRVVVIDPNSDFVRLRDARAGADPALAARLAALAPSILVRSPLAEGDDRLRIRFPELDGAAYAGVLQLDPIRDSDEYDELLRALEEVPGSAAYQALATGSADPVSEGLDRLIRRVRNLGVDRFGVWAREQVGTVLEDLDRDDWRCLVVDIGTLGTPTERTLVAQAVLSRLWEKRLERRPLLVVIDEAHNVCPQLPDGGLQFLATETAIKIAAEGRKFGLYLLLSTQRPQKVHENIVSQCDNLLLMRMNSAADVGHLTDVFSFVPPSLLARATGFRQGEALVAGKLVPTPTFVRFGARVSEEGGSDVPADWARRGATS